MGVGGGRRADGRGATVEHLDGELDDTGSVARAVHLGAQVGETGSLGDLVDKVVDAQSKACRVAEIG